MPRTAKGGGERGPLKTPDHLKLAPPPEGAPAAPTAVSDIVPAGRPEMPSGMTVAEQRIWTQLVDALVAAGIVAACDGLTIELAVRHYCAAAAAHRTLKRSGASIRDDKNKRDAKAPASAVFMQHSQAFREYAKLLGLSFAARARIEAPDGGAHGDGTRNPFQQPTGT